MVLGKNIAGSNLKQIRHCKNYWMMKYRAQTSGTALDLNAVKERCRQQGIQSQRLQG